MSGSAPPADVLQLNLLLFSVAGTGFAVDVEQVSAMGGYAGEQADDLCWFHELLGFDAAPASYRSPTVLTVKARGKEPYRVIIDTMEDIAEYRWDTITPLPSLLEPYGLRCGLWGIVRQDDRLVLLVDLQRIQARTANHIQ